MQDKSAQGALEDYFNDMFTEDVGASEEEDTSSSEIASEKAIPEKKRLPKNKQVSASLESQEIVGDTEALCENKAAADHDTNRDKKSLEVANVEEALEKTIEQEAQTFGKLAESTESSPSHDHPMSPSEANTTSKPPAEERVDRSVGQAESAENNPLQPLREPPPPSAPPAKTEFKKAPSRGFANHELDLAALEEHKRQKLQSMLDQQAIPKAMPLRDIPSNSVGPKDRSSKASVTDVTTKLASKVDTPEKPLPAITAQEALEQVVGKPVQEAPVADTSAEPSTDNLSAAIAPTGIPAKEVSKEDLAEQDASELSVDPGLLKWGENGRPLWAQNRFEALLFDVSGLTLAVPLVALGQITPLNDKLRPIAGQSDWFMGIMPSPVGDIRTVNTALFVMPEKYNGDFTASAKYVISIDGFLWGLAVDAINQPITLEPEDVNWRSERGKRAWLAGTVKSKMCALLDIPQMAQMLNTADKNLQ